MKTYNKNLILAGAFMVLGLFVSHNASAEMLGGFYQQPQPTSYSNNVYANQYINPGYTTVNQTSNVVAAAPVETPVVEKTVTNKVAVSAKKKTAVKSATASKETTTEVKDDSTTKSSLTSLAVSGDNKFMPDSILEWIFVFFLIMILILLIRQFRPKQELAHH